MLLIPPTHNIGLAREIFRIMMIKKPHYYRRDKALEDWGRGWEGKSLKKSMYKPCKEKYQENDSFSARMTS